MIYRQPMVFLALLLGALCAAEAPSQDREIGNARAALIAGSPYTTLVTGGSTSLRLGWNWGLPMTALSDACHATTMHYGYTDELVSNGALSPVYGSRFKDSTSTADTIFLFPQVRRDSLAVGAEYGKEEYKCLRYDPEITVQKTGFTPSATASPGATFGFRYRHAAVGVSGVRATLDDADFAASSSTLVLAEVWPDSAMMTRWASLVDMNNHDDDRDRTGHHLLLSVNLRRAPGAPTTSDTTSVLQLQLKYTTFGGDSGYVKFSYLPNVDSMELLNQGDPTYGNTYKFMYIDPSTPTFTIRREHLPADGSTINVSALVIFPDTLETGTPTNPVLCKLYGPHDSTTAARLDVEVSYLTHASSSDNLDVEIDCIKLETPQARNFLSGNDSATFVGAHLFFLNDLDSVNQITGRRYRVASWYGKDEAYMMYWEGWRQYNNLFDSLTVSEVRLGSVRHMLHKTGTRRLWQGNTPWFSKLTAAPYIERGFADKRLPNDLTFDYLEYKSGTEHLIWNDNLYHEPSQTENGCWVDYETWWGERQVDMSHYSVELPMPDSAYVGKIVYGSEMSPVMWMSPQVTIEGHYYQYALESDYLFLGAALPWYANLWPNSEWVRTASDPGIHVNSFRPWTGSEVYAVGYGQLILGAKGLITYYAASNDEESNPHKPAYTGQDGDILAVGAVSFLNKHIEPQGTGLTLVRSDSLGPDFFLPAGSEPTQITDFMVHAGSPTASDPGYFADKLGVDASRLYAGRESNRLALYRLYGYAHHHRATLEGLELQSWWAKGYKQWTLEKVPGTLENFLALDSSLAVAHPSRVDSLGGMDREDYDSVFADITLHKHRDTSLNQKFFVGIANRRTDPRLWDDGSWEFATEAEFEDKLAAHTAGAYDQRGARELRLPFHYQSPDGLAYNLHVSELAAEGTEGIDTVIGANSTLALRLRPGQGTFLRVEPVRASSQDGQVGYLDHSNQRKLVAFPKVTEMVQVTDSLDMRTYLRLVAGDTMWYHQVYHRRRAAVLGPESGFLTVYYRRSKPLLTTGPGDTTGASAYAFDASTIAWEEPIVVSDRVVYTPAGTSEQDTLDLSCGYPALVVRPYLTGAETVVSQVYVVFGCEYTDNQNNDAVLVCETVLPAEASTAEQQAYYAANPSQVLDLTPAPEAPILAHWGTPMVNASASGNFYCWSHATEGIGVGFKEPQARQFAAGQTMYLHSPLFGAGWYCTHPSVNTYSRLHIGEEDAAVVWQEGANPEHGTFIYYTRLWHGAAPGYAIGYELTPGGNPTVVGPPLIDQGDAQLGRITDTYVTVDSTEYLAEHAYPMVYRHLSDWETTAENARHGLRLVNCKADRIYWQARKVNLGLGPWMIGRRNVDVTDSSISPAYGTDLVFSQGEEFIYSQQMNLRGPDATQGEQWGEPGSIPGNADPVHYDDSCSALNFWSDTADLDPAPHIWHMLYGFEFYGSAEDYTTGELIADGKLQQIHGTGWYPHLAARYSVSAHRGYQRSRRVYDNPLGTWPQYLSAPLMTSSSEYFYKQTDEPDQPQAVIYSGFRGRGYSTMVGDIRLSGEQGMVPLLAVGREKAAGDLQEPPPERFVTDWLSIGEARDVELASSVRGDKAAGTVAIERESDGMRLQLGVATTKQGSLTSRSRYTLVGDRGDRYRFIVEPLIGGVYPVNDVEITDPASELTLRRTAAGGSQYLGLIDLREMRTANISQHTMTLYPNPAADNLCIAFDCRKSSVGSAPSDEATPQLTITISSIHGELVWRATAAAAGAVHVDTSILAAGVYAVTLQKSLTLTPICSARLVILR